MSSVKTFIEDIQRRALLGYGVNTELVRQVNLANLSNLRSDGPAIASVSADGKEFWSLEAEAAKVGFYDGKQVPKVELYRRLGKDYLGEDLSEYEDPYQYIRLRQAEDEIRQAAKELGHVIPAYPKIGTIDSATFNAEVWAIPGMPQKLVLFNFGILYYYEALVRCCVRLLKWKQSLPGGNGVYEISQQHALEVIASEREVVEFFHEALTEVLRCQLDFKRGSFPKPEAHMIGLDQGLRSSIWLFLMGHEYGHIIHGDLDSGSQSGDLSDKWQKEYYADARGFELMNQAIEGKYPVDFTHRVIGMALCFAGIDLIYRSVSSISGHPFPPPDASHPHPIERWKRLTRVIYQNSEDKQLSLAAFGFGSAIADIAEVLFAYSEPVHQKLRPERDAIRRIWLAT